LIAHAVSIFSSPPELKPAVTETLLVVQKQSHFGYEQIVVSAPEFTTFLSKNIKMYKKNRQGHMLELETYLMLD
jgi:hypothetical protein